MNNTYKSRRTSNLRGGGWGRRKRALGHLRLGFGVGGEGLRTFQLQVCRSYVVCQRWNHTPPGWHRICRRREEGGSGVTEVAGNVVNQRYLGMLGKVERDI